MDKDTLYKQKELHKIIGKIDTKDPQRAELEGVKIALDYIKNKHPIITNNNNYTILCDYKNVVNYINKKYNVPKQYAEKIQQVTETLHLLKHKDLNIQIKWIPGHTDNPWNDRADELAKAGAQLWLEQQTTAPATQPTPLTLTLQYR